LNISVVIPVYNSEPTLVRLVAELQSVLADVTGDYEIILVNDGSKDLSWEHIKALCGKYEHLRGINMLRNYGQHSALLAGIRRAQFESILTMDDDFQNPCSDIPKLIDQYLKGYDVVYGTPATLEHGVLRNLASRLTKLVLKGAMGAETAEHISAFRLFRAQIREAFSRYNNPFVCIDVLLTWGATKFSAVPVVHEPRLQGQSNYSLIMLVSHALNMVTGFSVLPLQIASFAGLAATLFGLLVLVYILTCYVVLGHSVPGFPFLASIVALFSGVQLFCLGVIGEYLARMYARQLDRPCYVVSDMTGRVDDFQSPDSALNFSESGFFPSDTILTPTHSKHD
jgi:glycosyltransferase involved in cell wall biosynthesis